MRNMKRQTRYSLIGLILVILIAAICYFLPSPGRQLTSYILKLRSQKMLAYLLVSIAVAFQTVSFQTITHNRFLTPAILGLESVYVLLQTVSIWISWQFWGQEGSYSIFEFGFSLVLQLIFFSLLQGALKQLLRKDMMVMLLISMALGTLFRSSATFIQVLMDPNEYDKLQTKLFASFQHINTNILAVAGVCIIGACCYLWLHKDRLDLLLLGDEQALLLGVDLMKEKRRALWSVVLLSASTTALVGPMTYFGFLVANLSYLLLKEYQHRYHFMVATLLAIAFLLVGQFFVERVFHFDITVSLIIELLGGFFFFYLLFKERQTI